jgi:hypothetical protein
MNKKEQIKAILESFTQPVDITSFCGTTGRDDNYVRMIAKELGYRVSTKLDHGMMLMAVESLGIKKAPDQPEDPMKTLLRIMFNGWLLHEQSWDIDRQVYTRLKEDCFIEAAGGDKIRGILISLFDYWGNDIQSLAPHYGIATDRDENSELIIREDIPPAPSPDHWWSEGKWLSPEEMDL